MPHVSLESETSNELEETFHFLQSKAFTLLLFVVLLQHESDYQRNLGAKKKKSK